MRKAIYKVGQTVVCVGNGTADDGDYATGFGKNGHFGTGWKKGREFKIDRIIEHEKYIIYWSDNGYLGVFEEGLRLKNNKITELRKKIIGA